MLRSFASRSVPTAALLIAALTAPAASAQPIGPVAVAVDCRELEPHVVPGAVPAQFLPNAGQREDGVDFHLPVIGDGLTVGPGGIAFGAGERRTVQQFLDAAPSFTAGAGGAGAAATVLAADTAWALTGAAALETETFLPGITLELTSTHRVLTLRLHAEPGRDPATVRWNYAGAAETYAAPGSGENLRVRRADGGHLEVRSPRAWQVAADGAEIPITAAFTIDGDGTVGLAVDPADPERGWHVEIETFFAAASSRYRAVRHGEDVVIAARATSARGGADGDILAFGLSGDGAVLWSALLAGDAEDEPHAVAIDADGTILIAGATGSSDLPALPGEGAGGRDGFVVRLAPRGLEPLAGTRVHAAGGDEVAGAVFVDQDGSVLIGGQSEVAPAPHGGFSFAALVPVVAGELRPTYLSRLDAELSQVLETVGFDAPPLPQLAIWRGCDDEIVYGQGGASRSHCGDWPNLTYAMEYKDEDYDLDNDFSSSLPGLGYPPGGWGYHALRWRYYQANDVAAPPAWTVDWSLAPSSTPIPKNGSPSCGNGDHDRLNDLETILFKQGGSTADPPGGWACSSHASVQHLALAAAFYSQRYDSATYTHFRNWETLYPPYGWMSFPVAIEETEWDVHCPHGPSSYNGQGLEDLCDFTSGWLGGVNCAASASGVIGGTASQPFYLKATGFETADWFYALTWYGRGHSYAVSDAGDYYEPGDYVVDPPDDPFESLLVEEAMAQLSSYTAHTLPVRLDIYDETGEVTDSSEGSVTVTTTSSR